MFIEVGVKIYIGGLSKFEVEMFFVRESLYLLDLIDSQGFWDLFSDESSQHNTINIFKV